MIRRGAVLLVALGLAVGGLTACGSDDPVLEPPIDDSTPPGGGACSAAALPSRPQDQAGIPQAVADTRRLIVGAATGCGYARLGHVAARGDDPFSFTFGAEGDAEAAAAFWKSEENAGREPLRFLVELLDRPFATRDVPEGVQYVWPSAFAHDTWADVPAGERDALRPLYDDTDFAFFESFGGYAGYRIGIAEDGEWLFFVAGD